MPLIETSVIFIHGFHKRLNSNLSGLLQWRWNDYD